MKWLRYVLGILISIALLGYILYKVDLGILIDEISKINYYWLPLAVLVYLGGIWVRTTRWAVLMRPVKSYKTAQLYPIYIINYMANNILPFRVGDLYRAYFIGKKDGISKGATLVTVVIERIFDGLTMLVFLAVSLWFFPMSNPQIGIVSDPETSFTVEKAIRIGSYIFLGAILACYVVVLRKSWMVWIFEKLLPLVPIRLHERLREIFGNFYKGLDSLRGIREIILVILLSLATWLIEAFSYVIILWAFKFYGSYYVAISTLAMVNLAIIAIPSTGGFGPFESAIIWMTASFYRSVTNFTREVATAYALIVHFIGQWIPTTLLGVFYMWKERLSFKEVQKNV
ncbi:flippase-like domain-containing protein [bacterium]|nr:flippase-like domain-containing protein [candidate division CSSED10-310 bacterium]